MCIYVPNVFNNVCMYYVCMYVCVYVCMYTILEIHHEVRICTELYVRMHVCMHCIVQRFQFKVHVFVFHTRSGSCEAILCFALALCCTCSSCTCGCYSSWCCTYIPLSLIPFLFPPLTSCYCTRTSDSLT